VQDGTSPWSSSALRGAVWSGLVCENLVAVSLIVLVAGECVFLSQFAEPWSRLWPLLIPANAIGNMVGNIVRLALSDSSRGVLRDVWVINGAEDLQTDSAKATSLAALSSWDSAEAGRFFVERNEALFEARPCARAQRARGRSGNSR
jgi:hypothetical protein